ncbi:fibronectin type III domain-containing protein [Agromyces protaetiae]|uniref:Fibronectin type III domain-containing protein n=1 Tax=Agromyces protaetiae TaxID=2509455 RepID=A0A4P6FEU0_9MICO|nr:Ig-like domain-containing protein [Agromyces protaetiae]QAY74454.1 fibronectin type III domain-containing protein [Agromyces protaetiae]
MMRFSDLKAKRSTVITGGAVAALVGLVGGAALVSGGYKAERVDLGDGSVWVVNDRLQSVGRANTIVDELNSVVETGAPHVELVQSGRTVLAVDHAAANVGVIDPTSSTLLDTVPVPPDEPQVAIAGANVVVASAGDVWITPVDGFVDFDPDDDPSLQFGAQAVVSIDGAGIVFAYSPSTGVVERVDAERSSAVSGSWQSATTDAVPQITSVDGRWAVLDPESETLALEGGSVDLSDVLESGDDPLLQKPSVDGTRVVIGTRRGLVLVPLDGTDPTFVADGASGLPAQPVQHGGCLHAAWAGGTAWRSCDGSPGAFVQLDGGIASTSFEFLENGDALVLNDPRSGLTWAAASDHALIDNWDELADEDRADEEVERDDDTQPPTLERAQSDPVAESDVFGARPGRATLLPVLLNDYDPNGDVLVVDSVDGTLPDGVRLDLVSDRQQVQLTLPADASGSLDFGYTINDGRGASARARVSVEVRSPDQNGAPEQLRRPSAIVETGDRVSVPVLGEWVDPDGDPVFLRGASIEGGDFVGASPDGVVVFDERLGTPGSRSVLLAVSDGRDTGSGALRIDVKAAGEAELVAEPFVVLANAGEEVRIEPLRHVRGGSGPVRLVDVPAKPDATISADLDGGVFRFTSDDVRTHYLEYAATDGIRTVTGVIRVEVRTPPERATTPITVPHTAFLKPQEAAEVDVLASDIDPTGGVLVLTGLPVDAGELGVRAEIVEHRILRVTLDRPLELGSTEIRYRVSNGLASADGVVTLVEVPVPERRQPPVAVSDRISARTGDVVDVPVLANDVHPDGYPLTLAQDLVQAPERGLLFVAGDRLRYLAPDEPGEYHAAYRVEGPDGQGVETTVELLVRPADPETNSPPVPTTVTARAVAGESIRIPIPLGSTDPDGDSVELLGQSSNPERGVVAGRGADWLEYRASAYSPGTDTFRYEVVDALGARAVGTVRVGIAPRPDTAMPPVATADTVTVRPGRSVAVRVLANDSDPEGTSLTIISTEAIEGDARAEIVDDTVVIDIPDAEGSYSFLYTVQNARLATASNYVRVVARADAPLVRPEASDTVLGLSDIIGRDTVDADVLRNVFIADADVADARVTLVDPDTVGARVRADGSIRIDVEAKRRIIPFRVSHPDDPTLGAIALVRVPGRDDAVPQLRADAPDVRVESGEEVRIELDDFVIAASGRPVRLTDAASVRASHSDDSDLVVDEDTLRFRSAVGYFGPASLSFTVTDGETPDDPTARTGTIVIPIDVRLAAGQPPVFLGTVLDFEPGETKTIDLGVLTSHPSPGADDGLVFTTGPVPNDFDVSRNGDDLTIHASERAVQGTRSALSIGVSTGTGVAGTAGIIELRVAPSTKPLADPVPDVAVAARGTTTTIDVLANDRAGNPFPKVPLRVVGVRGVDADSLPEGVRIEPSEDRSTLTVSVSRTAAAVDTTVQYQVADATGDPSRFTWGLVTVQVQDRPDPVTGARVSGFGDRRLQVEFGAGAYNNSAIADYQVTLLDQATREQISTTACTATTCSVPTAGNGRDHAVVVRIQARNAIGLSDPVEVPTAVWSDVVPPAPASLTVRPLDGALRIEWPPVASTGGSGVRAYVVTVGGVSAEVGAAAACTVSACTYEAKQLANGSQVPVEVSARNDAYPALADWNGATAVATPFGSPIAGAVSVAGDAATGTVTVSWSPFDGNGDAVAGYFVQRLVAGDARVPTGPQACRVSSPAPGEVIAPTGGGNVAEMVRTGADASSVRFSGALQESATYSFVVWAFNRAGCTHGDVVGTVVRPAPGAIGGVASEMGWLGDTTWDRYISGVDGGSSVVQIVAVDAGGVRIGQPASFSGTGWLRELLNRPYGETAWFQVRACTVWGSCGPWSQTFPAGESPTLTFEVPGRTWNAGIMTWTWAGPPDNRGLPAAFRCGVEGDETGVASQTPVACIVPGATSESRVWFDVEVAGVTARFWNR